MVTRISLLVAIVAHCVAMHAGAQDYPAKSVRIIAPSVGTSADILARFISQKLNERWGQSIIVENRSGAPSAMMPAKLVARATPDGYTLLMGETSSLATAPRLFAKLEYNPMLDFAPITQVARAPLALIVSNSAPVSNLGEFISRTKERPNTLNYASAATAGISHLTTEMFLQLTGIKAVHVPYKGAGAGTLAVVAGEVQFAAIAVSSAMPQINASKVKALAVTSKQRFAPIENVPTTAEAGLSGLESETWFGLLVPARTPPVLVKRLESELVSILKQPDVRQKIFDLGAEPQQTTSDEFKRFIQAETKKWARVITAAKIGLQ